MSKLRNLLVALVALSLFMVTPAFPQGIAGWKNCMFIGSYTTLITFPDVWGEWDLRFKPDHQAAHPAQ